jgi:Ca2+-dependent lipid-binding protein
MAKVILLSLWLLVRKKEKSKTIKHTLNPQWNEKFEFPVENCDFEQLVVTVYDYDFGSSPDFMGVVSIPISDVAKTGSLNDVWTLNDVKSGQIEMQLDWVKV